LPATLPAILITGTSGVRSCRELAADLFFKHYLRRIERGSGVCPPTRVDT